MKIIKKIPGKEDKGMIDEFEGKIGHNLPSDYRDFLLSSNGGMPDKPVFKFGEGNYSESMVRYFFGFTSDASNSLQHKHEIYTLANRLPGNIIPIACDSGGNIVGLSCQGDDFGSVYFWDHEQEGLTDESATYSGLKKIAVSFSEFVEHLEEEVY